MRFHGLTWNNPRGFNALAAAARQVAPRGLLNWDKQPLEGFESHPIGDLAARFDLIVIDHPHIGEAVALCCLRALDEVFCPKELADWGAWLRPRHDGHIRFRTHASALIRECFAERWSSHTTLMRLREASRQSRHNARGPLP